MYVAILAGGKGKRFWPFSRAGRPKQFLDITGEGSMLSLTFRRVLPLARPEKIIVLTVKDQESLVRTELPELPADNIITEPVGRNTAPSLALAAAAVKSRGGDEPILCCPSDHLIVRTDEFERVCRAAASLASEKDLLVTFGIAPDHPSTGYGYIEAGDRPAHAGNRSERRGPGGEACPVIRFHEKPGSAKATEYLEKGTFFWNSGMFMWRPSVFLKAWDKFLPAGREPIEKIGRALEGGDSSAAIEDEYPRLPAISVDYGILEKADNVVVIPADIGWSDVGSWDALGGILPADGYGNSISGKVESIDSAGNIFFNPNGVTAAIGVKDLIVVADGGIVMVCRRGDSQRVKELMELLEKNGEETIL